MKAITALLAILVSSMAVAQQQDVVPDSQRLPGDVAVREKMGLVRAEAMTQSAAAIRLSVETRSAEIGLTKRSQFDVHAQTSCPATPIQIPTTIDGNLTTSSCIDEIGLRDNVYSFTATAGQTLTIIMSSSSFDVFPYLYGATRTTLSYRSSGGTSSVELDYSVTATRTYTIEAEALWYAGSSQPNTGPYTLTIAVGGVSPPPGDYPNHACGLYPIQCGGSQSARLTYGSCVLNDGTFADFYTFSGTIGQRVTATLSVASSTYTRPFIALLPPTADTTSPPSGTGTTSASIVGFTLTSSGVWTIGVSTLDTFALGNYTVSLSCVTTSQCVPPSITSQPSSQTIESGHTVNISAGAAGTAPLSYQWYAGQSGDMSQPLAGLTGSSFIFSGVITTSAWLRVSNSCGSVNSATVTVTVITPCQGPVIAEQPSSIKISAGGTAHFSLRVTGTEPITIEWYERLNTGDILRATGADFNVSPAKTTSYYALVRNSCGVGQSATFTVIIGGRGRAVLH